MQRHDDRHAAHKFRDEAELEQILRQDVLKKRADVLLHVGLHIRAKAHDLLARALCDDILDARERTAADEEDLRGVDLDELLVRMLAPALRRHACDRAFEDLQQRLLHAFAGNIARDGSILALAGDLVDLIDVDDALLRAFHVVIRSLDELEQDVLHILAHIARLGQGRGVRHGEGDVQDLRKRLRKHGLAAARGPQHDDVALLQLHIVVRRARVDALVVVVDRNGKRALCVLLADDVLIQNRGNVVRLRDIRKLHRRSLHIIFQDLAAKLDALIADIDAWPRDDPMHLILRFAAEGALHGAFLVGFCHSFTSLEG